MIWTSTGVGKLVDLNRRSLPQPLRFQSLQRVLHFPGKFRVEVEAGLPLNLPDGGEKLAQRLTPSEDVCILQCFC